MKMTGDVSFLVIPLFGGVQSVHGHLELIANCMVILFNTIKTMCHASSAPAIFLYLEWMFQMSLPIWLQQ